MHHFQTHRSAVTPWNFKLLCMLLVSAATLCDEVRVIVLEGSAKMRCG